MKFINKIGCFIIMSSIMEKDYFSLTNSILMDSWGVFCLLYILKVV